MKYFITENGLVSFDLTPAELVYKLLTNPHQIQPPDDGSFKMSINAIEQIMDKPYCLFKHPDMSDELLLEITGYTPHVRHIDNIEINDYYLLIVEYKNSNQVSIISSLENDTDLYGKRYYHTLQYTLIDKPVVKNWERKLFIDTILKDLQE